jgi:hypothetical protein
VQPVSAVFAEELIRAIATIQHVGTELAMHGVVAFLTVYGVVCI